MVISPGANHRLGPDDVRPPLLRRARLLHLTGYSFFQDGPAAAARRAWELAHEVGAPVSVDPASAGLIQDVGVRTFLREIRGAHFLFPNLDEGRLLSGEEEPESILRALRRHFPVVGLKLGAAGCLCAGRGDREPVAVPAMAPPAVVDTTGAGDAWDAAFLVTHLATRDLAAAARRANEVAAWVVARPGARPKGWAAAGAR